MRITTKETVGDLLLDLEVIYTKLYEQHGLQLGDTLGMLYTYTHIHHPESVEEFLDGSRPVFHYKHKDVK